MTVGFDRRHRARVAGAGPQRSSDGPCDGGLWNRFHADKSCSQLCHMTRWFVRKRSIALSIASSGLSLGGIAISPVIATIIDADSLIYWAPRLAIAFLIGMLPASSILSASRTRGAWSSSTEILRLPPSVATQPCGCQFQRSSQIGCYFILISVTFVIVMAAQVGAIQHTFK